jgi:hypothetical protein
MANSVDEILRGVADRDALDRLDEVRERLFDIEAPENIVVLLESVIDDIQVIHKLILSARM